MAANKKAAQAAARKQRRAVTRARQKDERRRALAAKKQAEEENLAPAVQRNPVLDASQNVVKVPRVYRRGKTFEVLSPIEFYCQKSEQRDNPTFLERHKQAARRLVQAWEEGAVGIGQGSSDYSRESARRGLPSAGFSDELIKKLDYQRKQRDLYIAAQTFMGALWPITKAVLIDAVYVKTYAERVGMERNAAYGYFVAALDRLVDFWKMVDKPEERRTYIRVAEIVASGSGETD